MQGAGDSSQTNAPLLDSSSIRTGPVLTRIPLPVGHARAGLSEKSIAANRYYADEIPGVSHGVLAAGGFSSSERPPIWPARNRNMATRPGWQAKGLPQ